MNDETEITPEAVLRGILLHGSRGHEDRAQVIAIAAAALLIREGLDNLAKDNRPLTPDEDDPRRSGQSGEGQPPANAR